MTGLEPGEYTVLAPEWRGDEPQPPQQQQQQQQRKAITTRYPPDFVGDTMSFDAATKLHLHSGDAPHVQLHLRAAKYYPVTIPVAGSTAGVAVRVSGAMVPGGSSNLYGFTLGYNNRDHAVEGSLPDGDYTLILSQHNGDASFAVLPVHIEGAPFVSAPVAMVAGKSIPVRVDKEFTQVENTSGPVAVMGVGNGQPQSQPPAQIYLRPLELGGEGAGSKTGPDGEVLLDDVPPGEYTVQTSGVRGYVASLTSDGVDLLHHPLVVSLGGRSDPIDIVLRDDTGVVKGAIDPGSDPRSLAQGSFLALIPDGSGSFTEGFAGPDGKFQVSNVAPGTYRILAFRGSTSQQIAYREPKSLEAWRGEGATVTVTAGGTAQVNVPLLDESEAHPE
jgi:hypothetical protein